MTSKNDQNFIAFCDELRAYVEEHHLFPDKHTIGNNWVRYQRKCIKAGTLEDWKQELFEELVASRSNSHTGGRKKKN